jgi:hypothetical protein
VTPLRPVVMFLNDVVFRMFSLLGCIN